MLFSFAFFFNSVMLGIGLAMDAFSVSLANGLNEPKMRRGRACLIAGVFAFFQFLMPMLGWVCVHSVASFFSAFQKFIPWIALILLALIGSNMLIEGIKNKDEEAKLDAVGITALLVQGVATSIDALSVGFTISEHTLLMALVCCLIIAVLTFFICVGGIYLGKKFGTRLAGKASIFGGCILIFIGIEIFVTSLV